MNTLIIFGRPYGVRYPLFYRFLSISCKINFVAVPFPPNLKNPPNGHQTLEHGGYTRVILGKFDWDRHIKIVAVEDPVLDRLTALFYGPVIKLDNFFHMIVQYRVCHKHTFWWIVHSCLLEPQNIHKVFTDTFFIKYDGNDRHPTRTVHIQVHHVLPTV